MAKHGLAAANVAVVKIVVRPAVPGDVISMGIKCAGKSVSLNSNNHSVVASRQRTLKASIDGVRHRGGQPPPPSLLSSPWAGAHLTYETVLPVLSVVVSGKFFSMVTVMWSSCIFN